MKSAVLGLFVLGSTRAFGVAVLWAIAGCSAADPRDQGAAGAAGVAGLPGQLGNGSPGGGQAGMTAMQLGGGGVLSAGGTPGLGGLPGASGAMATGTGGAFTSAGGISGMSGATGAGGTIAAGGTMSAGGTIGAGGGFGAGGVMSSGGTSMGGMAGMTGGNPEMGRLAGITAAHNAVRAGVQTMPPLQPLEWSDKLAQYAQQWADNQAMTSCMSPHHRTGQELQAIGYGENLAAFTSSFGQSTAQQAVDGWASEKMCWTYGTILGTEMCNTTCYEGLHSDGCGHYTAIVWRTSTQVGCGVATCSTALGMKDIWICNYAPPGNIVGRAPY